MSLIVAALSLLGISFLPERKTSKHEPVVTSGKILGVFLGDVEEGEVLKKEIRLRNDGDRPMRVEGIVTSCGCTGATVPRSEILPGEEVPLAVSIDTKDRKGLNRFRVSVSIAGAPPATVVFGTNVAKKG
ncbi:MAG: DUF1573 domain-containing protein [Tepidisphaeraceae bacterium]